MKPLSSETLFNLSPLDGRYASDLQEVQDAFSESRLIHERIHVEMVYLKAFLKATDRADWWKDSYMSIYTDIDTDDLKAVKDIERRTKHDVAAVIEFIKGQLPEKVRPYVHFGLTSEDVNNLSHGLMMVAARDILLKHLKGLIKELSEIASDNRDRRMIGRTHGEVATPTTMGKELALYSLRFAKMYSELKDMNIQGKILGATGNLNAFVGTYPDVDWFELTREVVEELGLEHTLFSLQIMPGDTYATLLDSVKRLSGLLIDYDQNIWTYFMLAYLYQKADASSIGSSTMPHKINPIKFENSEGNAQLAESLLTFFSQKFMKTRLQRDLTDSTVKRNIGTAFGHIVLAVIYAQRGTGDILINDAKMDEELANNGQFFSELVQLVERDRGASDGYDHLKKQTRGKRMSYAEMVEMMTEAGIEAETIETYVKGLTGEICDKALAEVKKLIA
ncbi:MAG: adenylosuccinate lyase [Candidatus Marinimicrobia bacterium]|jgi:adenylosuccinate lyase|nr:adenylosuccinate lyase [Candidatus Neomarinimicrobiota bacterium]MBT4715624.1 adenylosuccinate lyase [Candidatus Neomarinimicrobiota bacterium]MBT4945477.1 adenylosuccinate lyase [Candidatus Neomarinimicrobiota bacterium]MBT5270283.1 adenylosuccinate lyase [Candidatus Neomarinimicrobiota bacterium]MBT6010465.1 adenylosuccinate lyase [Candidatus Neomarinimicrobiota bacterium]